MKIVLAPDKFKGSLSAPQVCDALAAGIRRVRPDAQIDACPMADGGEGTVASMVAATGGRFEIRRVTGPLPETKLEATFGVLGDASTAVIEMAAASGLALLKDEDRNPLNTTTFGTGELLMAAAGLGVREIILGIGGSATVDGGIGCAQACGLPVLLDDGEPLSLTEPLCGRDLPKVIMIKHGRGSAIERVRIRVACDVVNPLFGPAGAARVFGPQKGATRPQVDWLDDALRGLAQRTGKLAEAVVPGAGAAGGLGFGMLAYFGATLQSGADIIIEATRLRERLYGADLCITGEGRLDAGSLHGKAPIAVARLCKSMKVPCVAVVGSVGAGAELALGEGIGKFVTISDGSRSVDECLRRAAELVERATVQLLEDGISPSPAGRGLG